jgi:cation transport regulator ChaB
MPYHSTSELPEHLKKLSQQKQRQWMHVWNESYVACMKDEFSRSSDCESEAFAKANGVVKGSDLNEQDIYHEEQYRLFLEAPLSSPDVQDGWYPFLPTPGNYSHAKYGQVGITREGNQALVDSVKNKVYQEHIPIDAEHMTKLSGAVAWLTDMRLNEDGSADAFFSWTNRGRMLMSGGQFKYVSPEFFGTWPDPATGVVHRNVVAGGALTTRPFFKDKVLRALVASEDGVEIIEQREFAEVKCETCDKPFEGSGSYCPDCKEKKSMGEPAKTPETPPVETIKASEVQSLIDTAIAAAKVEFNEELGKVNTELEAAKLLAASEKEAREASEKALKAERDAAREQRFRELVAGKGGQSDGAAWTGDPDKHVNTLVKMAEAFGEDSDTFKDHVENSIAAANAQAQAIFKEHGTSARGQATTGEDKIQKIAEKILETKPELTKAQAYAEALTTEAGREAYNEANAPR